MPTELHGHPLRPGTVGGVVDTGGVPGADRVLACADLRPYLGRAGLMVAALVGGPGAWDSGRAPPPGAPAVDGIDLDLLRPGDAVTVDGAHGTVRLTDVLSIEVVTAFLQREDDRILLLRRSAKVGSFQGRWAGVSGFLEERPPEAQAVLEIEEETGIPRESLRLARTGPAIYARDADRLYVVHPFRFRVSAAEVRLDWEHTEAEWVDVDELGRRSTVPRLGEAWEAVAAAGPADPSAGSGKR
jgi:8-oxo-dGTP diphosphatase